VKHELHIKRLGGSVVHLGLDNESTYCGWQYMSDATLNGHRIPEGANTTEPVNCRKCAGALRQAAGGYLSSLTPDQMEEIFLKVRELATGQR
jgi:hypothetical protein